MALPEAVKVQASHLTMIVAEEGLPPTKFKKKEKLIENRSDADPTQTP